MVKIYRYEKVNSTNEVAKTLASKRSGCKPFVVHANTQTAGKGRRGRSWESPDGGLYFSICTPRKPLLSLRGGVAVAKTLDAVVKPDVKLKWPNDVLVDDNKLCGILTEAFEETGIVGIGVNLDSAPLEGSTCLAFLTERPPSEENILERILEEFFAEKDADQVLEAYRNYCSTIGSYVKVKTPNGDVTGLARKIDRKGRLVIENFGKVTAGDVVHLRKSSAV